MEPAAPAVRGVVSPDTTRVVAPAALTTMPLWEPLMLAVTVSVAVTDWVAAVLRVRMKTWVPASVEVKT